MNTPSVAIYVKAHADLSSEKAGYAANLCYGATTKLVGMSHKGITANAGEILATILGLEQLKVSCEVAIISNSMYLVNEGNKLIMNGQIPYANRGAWLKLAATARAHNVTFEHVMKAESPAELVEADSYAAKMQRKCE